MLSKEIDKIRSTETALMNENDSLKNTLKSMKSEYQEQIAKLKSGSFVRNMYMIFEWE